MKKKKLFFDTINEFVISVNHYVLENSPSSIFKSSNMTLGFLVIFLYLVWFFSVPKSLLSIVRQWSCEKFVSLSIKPQSHVRILILSNVGYWSGEWVGLMNAKAP